MPNLIHSNFLLVDDPKGLKGLYATHDGGLGAYGQLKTIGEGPRRITDATSDKELFKAMSTYLNKAGAADYNLPKLTGEKIMMSNK